MPFGEQVGNSLRKWLGIFRTAYSGWAAAIGAIIATVALCNLIFRLMDASVVESLQWVLAAYQKTFHPPIDFITSLFSLRLPAAVKDALVLYVAVGGVLYRTLSYVGPSPLKMPGATRSRRREFQIWGGRVRAALLWPFNIKSIFRFPHLLIASSQGYHGRLPPLREDLASSRDAAVADMIGNDAVVLCDEVELLICYAVSLLCAVLAIVVLNGAIDRLG